MRTVQVGDQVTIRYVIRFPSGVKTSVQERGPLQLTVGTDHRRVPGLGLALLGMAPGARTSVQVTAAQAFGVWDPARVQRWSRKRFPGHAQLPVGHWVRFTDGNGRRRLVRILEVHGEVVLVDTNHRWAGQAVEFDVELLEFCEPGSAPARGDSGGDAPRPGR